MIRMFANNWPTNIVWSKKYVGFHWVTQKYGFGASCTTICVGFLTLRWHER